MAAVRSCFKCAHPKMATNVYCPGTRKEAETITEVNESGCSEEWAGQWGTGTVASHHKSSVLFILHVLV